MTEKGVVFDSSLDKGKPYDIRVGTGQVGRHAWTSRRACLPGWAEHNAVAPRLWQALTRASRA